MALDQAAAGHFDRAIALCRDALEDPTSVQPIRRAHTADPARQISRRTINPTRRRWPKQTSSRSAALKLSLENSDTVLEVSARHVMAKLLAARGNRARREARVRIGDRRHPRLPRLDRQPRAAGVGARIEQETFREYVDLLMHVAVGAGTDRFAPASRDEDDALRVLELARSSSSSPVAT